MNAARGIVRHYNSASSDIIAKAAVGGLMLINGVMRFSATGFLICATSLVYHMDQELQQHSKSSQIINVSESKQLIQELK